MLGIENELPMVVAGVHEGKNEICARIGYFNLGINLSTEKPTPLQIKNGVEKILADTMYKTNVERLSKEFNRYNPGELCARYITAVLSRPEKNRTAVIVNDVAA
jgi:UDP:flavonoid glycosyltransferase YjiC (YdhE family)